MLAHGNPLNEPDSMLQQPLKLGLKVRPTICVLGTYFPSPAVRFLGYAGEP